MNLNLFLCTALLLLLTGCLSLEQPAVNIDYYQIEYAPVNPSASEQLDTVLGIRRFTIATAYDHDRMVYKEGAFERQTYYYHRWITNPAEMIRDALIKDLQHAGHYRAVVAVPGPTAWDYEVQGYVREVCENDLGQNWESVVDLDITFIRTPPETSKRRVLFQKNYRASAACRGKDPKAVVAAMSTAMQEISAVLQTDIYKAIQEDLKENVGKDVKEEVKEEVKEGAKEDVKKEDVKEEGVKETKDARNATRYLVKAASAP